jgi:hypothetical protein
MAAKINDSLYYLVTTNGGIVPPISLAVLGNSGRQFVNKNRPGLTPGRLLCLMRFLV